MKLINYTIGKIGDNENYSILMGVTILNFSNTLILYLGIFLTKNNKLKMFEKMINPNYKNYIVQKSIEEFYETYKEYIEIVKNYISGREV